MGRWVQAAQCDAIDSAGDRCVLPAGHPGLHGVGAPPARPLAFVVGVIVLIVAGPIELGVSVVAYYGLGGATATPGPASWLMLLGLVALPAGVILSWMRRRRAAIASVAVLLLGIPVGLLALASSGPSGDPLSDGIIVLAFAVPGLLLLAYIWATPRLLDRGATRTARS